MDNKHTAGLPTATYLFIKPSENIFLNKINELIIANLDNNAFRNADLANKMFLSQSQLFRRIKTLTKRSTAIYIRSIRLQKARELLLNTNFTVSVIAYMTGFNSPFYFSSTFSKEFGFSPSLVR